MLLFWLAALLVFGLANFAFSVHILREVGGGGSRVGWFELRWQVHRKMPVYKERTRQRLGRIGGAWYGYWATLAGLLLSLLLFLLTLAAAE